VAKRKGNINLYNLKNIFETEGNSVEKSSLSHRCGYAYPSLELTLSMGDIAKFTFGKLESLCLKEKGNSGERGG
jgi:hypothetical protein